MSYFYQKLPVEDSPIIAAFDHRYCRSSVYLSYPQNSWFCLLFWPIFAWFFCLLGCFGPYFDLSENSSRRIIFRDSKRFTTKRSRKDLLKNMFFEQNWFGIRDPTTSDISVRSFLIFGEKISKDNDRYSSERSIKKRYYPAYFWRFLGTYCLALTMWTTLFS